MTETFSEPLVMRNIALTAILTYMYGTLVLHKSSYRRELYFDLMKYAYLYLFYAKAYPYA
jgi:hypothetical protein